MLNLENLTLPLNVSVEPVTVVKNSVELTGLKISSAEDEKTGFSAEPIVYYDDTDTAESVSLKIKEIMMSPKPVIDVQWITWPYVKDNVYLAVQRVSEDRNLVRRPYLNLELVLRVRLGNSEDGITSYKVTTGVLKNLGVTEEELYRAAAGNCEDSYSVKGMQEVLFGEEPEHEDLYVVNSRSRIDGASAIAFPEVFQEFCDAHDEEDCYILPSSTEELLIVRGSAVDIGGIPLQKLADMVSEVNSAEVAPELQLDPVVYRYDTESKTICIAASAEV